MADSPDRKAPLRRHRALPNRAQVEHERSMWGPHPDPAVNALETRLWLLGYGFLQGMVSAVLGKPRPALGVVAKAEPPKPPGWGEIAAMFAAPGSAPMAQMATWESLVAGFSQSLLPAVSIENAMAAWALQSSLMSALGPIALGIRSDAWKTKRAAMPPAQAEMLDWTKARGANFITELGQKARSAVLNTLIENRLEGGDHHRLSATLQERFGVLARDWRRVAVTETAMAVSWGQLAAVADSGDWEAVWVAGPNACPFCHGHAGLVLQIVRQDHPNKNGETMVWPGKHNVGRSAHPFTKDGIKRTPSELWWPTIPAHPLCCCVWTIRRIVRSAVAKKAQGALDAKRAAAHH